MVALRREFGIGAEEAYTRLPAWEVDMLLGSLEPDDEERPERASAGAVNGDPFDDVPEHLAAL